MVSVAYSMASGSEDWREELSDKFDNSFDVQISDGRTLPLRTEPNEEQAEMLRCLIRGVMHPNNFLIPNLLYGFIEL